MSENIHDIDDLFNKAIEQHTETPSSNVWNAIDKNLDKKKVLSISRKYYKLKWAAAVLLLFSFGMAMYTLKTRMKNKELVKQNNINNAFKKNKEVIKSDEKKSANSPIAIPGTEKNDENQKDKQRKADNRQIVTNTAKEGGLRVDSSNKRLTVQGKEKTRQDIITNPNKNQSAEPRRIEKKEGAEDNNPASADKETTKDPGIIAKQNEDQSKTPRENNTEKQAKNNYSASADKNKIETTDITSKKYSTGVPLIFNYEPQYSNVLQIHGSNPVLYKPVILAYKPADIKNKGNASAGKATAKPLKHTLFFASAFVSPEFVSFKVRDDHPRYREDNRNQIKNNEKPGSSLTYGILLGYNAGNNWTLQSGVSVFSGVTDINTKTIYARPDGRGNINYRLSCSAGSAFVPLKSATNLSSGDSTKILSAKNTLQYVIIPFVVKYTIGKGKLTMVPGVGISGNILSKGKIETRILATGGKESSDANNIEGLKSMFFNSQLSLGAEYYLSKKIALNFTPTARLALSSINKDEAVKTKLNSFGLSTGISIKF